MSRVEHIGRATLYLGDCRDILPTLPKVLAHADAPDPSEERKRLIRRLAELEEVL